MAQEARGPECGSQPRWGTGTFSEFCLTTERERAFSVVSLWVNMLSTVYTVAVKMAFPPSILSLWALHPQHGPLCDWDMSSRVPPQQGS